MSIRQNACHGSVLFLSPMCYEAAVNIFETANESEKNSKNWG